MSSPLRLLVVEDEPELRHLLLEGLTRHGFAAAGAVDGDDALRALGQQEYDVVLLDLRMPGRDGIQVLQAMRAEAHDAEVIVVTGHADVDSAIEAVKLHAFDYVTKPFQLPELLQSIGRAAERARQRREHRWRRHPAPRPDEEALLHGRSRVMERLRLVLDLAADSASSVLILGESGTGKELCARSIHRSSPRSAMPFLALNCAALPDELLESELFGHERGAFTGAAARRHGLLELAHEGTLFLDEVGEMSVAMQAKLLRALDQGEIRRLGGDRTLHVDVRIIAATNRDLTQAAATGRFRHDLYYRLGVVVIDVPPLRDRVEDIPQLVEHFAAQVALPGRQPLQVTSEAMALLTRYAWPGNVRELRNIVERLSVLAPDGVVSAADVALYLPAAPPDGADTALVPLEEIERRYILEVLRRCGDNRTRAAKVLGVDPKTLYNKLKTYG
jgi:two-component system response regulator HydG